MTYNKFDTFDSPHARGESGPEEPATSKELWPRWAHVFLENLIVSGCVSRAARAVGYSRSTIYKLAARSPSFRRALDEAKLEFRDLLLGEAHRQAIVDKSPSVMRALLGLYFPQVVNRDTGEARLDPSRITDEEIGQVARDELEGLDLNRLDDDELETLDRLLARAGDAATP